MKGSDIKGPIVFPPFVAWIVHPALCYPFEKPLMVDCGFSIKRQMIKIVPNPCEKLFVKLFTS